MTNRHTLKFSILAAAILALCLPAMAAAQWDRGNDNRDRGRDNRDRDRDGYGRYDERALRDSVHRLDPSPKTSKRTWTARSIAAAPTVHNVKIESTNKSTSSATPSAI